MKVRPAVKSMGPGDYMTRDKGVLKIRNKKKPKHKQRQG